MAMTSSPFDHAKLDRVEEGDKPQGKAVRRNLFGPVDHQQLQQDLDRLLCLGAEVAEQRWNFDFASDHPTPGSVKWEEMQCQDVPAFYRSCVVRAGKRRPEVPISQVERAQSNTDRLLSQPRVTRGAWCVYMAGADPVQAAANGTGSAPALAEGLLLPEFGNSTMCETSQQSAMPALIIINSV